MIEIKIPKLGLTMEEAKLSSWQFKSGDQVKNEDVLLVIETDKVSFEVPSPADGIIHPVIAEGETCQVEQIVGYLAENHEEYEQIFKEQPGIGPGGEGKIDQTPAESISQEVEAPSPAPSTPKAGRIKVSPLARSMATSNGLDLASIAGTGPGGRIVKADILRELSEGKTAHEKAPEVSTGAADKGFIGKELLESISIKGIRRAIFDNMYQSISQSAQLTLHTEGSAESLIVLRKGLNSRLAGEERKISYNAILVKLTAAALRMHPRINVSVEGDAASVWKQVHIGLAMEANDALIVPVIRNPDLKSIKEINQDISELISRTRENRLSPDDLANGTFTVSSLGFADVDHFTPIIRPPESGILGVGRIIKKPVVKNDQIIPEDRIGLSFTFDHRIIDGAPAARFLKTIKDLIEDPILMIS